jgi:hypothetical protein
MKLNQLRTIDPTADPTAGMTSDVLARAARPSSLAGKVVALLDNRKEQGELILKTLGEALCERYGVARVVFRQKGHYSKPAPDALIDEMAKEAQLAVVGLGG